MITVPAGDRWRGRNSGPVVRPYAVTGGRTEPAGGEVLDVSGDPGELTLFMSGRQESAHVTLVGPDALVDKLRNAKLGL